MQITMVLGFCYHWPVSNAIQWHSIAAKGAIKWTNNWDVTKITFSTIHYLIIIEFKNWWTYIKFLCILQQKLSLPKNFTHEFQNFSTKKKMIFGRFNPKIKTNSVELTFVDEKRISKWICEETWNEIWLNALAVHFIYSFLVNILRLKSEFFNW